MYSMYVHMCIYNKLYNTDVHMCICNKLYSIDGKKFGMRVNVAIKFAENIFHIIDHINLYASNIYIPPLLMDFN